VPDADPVEWPQVCVENQNVHRILLPEFVVTGDS
jgi:hypothetical protein